MRVPPSDVLQQLLDDARLSEGEIEERLRQAFDTAYWRGLAQDLHVVDALSQVESGEANAAAIVRGRPFTRTQSPSGRFAVGQDSR